MYLEDAEVGMIEPVCSDTDRGGIRDREGVEDVCSKRGDRRHRIAVPGHARLDWGIVEDYVGTV